VSGVGKVLAESRAQGRAALVGYLPVGFPDVSASIDAMVAMVEAGVDIVEVGMPYTDPLMDGPVIAHAADVALQSGTRLGDVFTAVRAVVEAGAPALVMTYWNPVLRYGVERFAEDLGEAGGAGLITPDLIPDEGAEWIAAADRNHLDHVFLVAPSSTPQRLRSTTAACSGFVYAASSMGVTGARRTIGDAAQVLVARTRLVTDLPVCVGLGVSTGAQAAQVAAFADGVIVGSALVGCLSDAVTRVEGLTAIRKLSAELAAGVHDGR
jgi:tryptophan synthase alpha chain